MPELHWRMIGPFRGGRTRAASGVADQPNVFYMGQVDGGVWKTEDAGRTWRPIFDAQKTQSIGAIAVAPSDSNVVYVASGEGLHRPDLSVGDGVYRSENAGSTWTFTGRGTTGSSEDGLRDGQQIPALAVDPHDPNRVFAAVLGHPYGPNEERGIFRSTDGGVNWKKVLYKGPGVGGSDVEIDPAHPNVVYAALWESRLGPWEDANSYSGTGGGLFKSVDGGDTWKQLNKGLPENLVQIQVAIAASDSSRLYATLSTTKEGGYGSGSGLGFYRSDDAGETWRKATDDPRPAMKIGGGDLPVPKVDPKNPDVVYSASIVTTRSVDGGKTWTSLRGAPGGDDYQNLWINPVNPQVILLVSDQGAAVTVNGGESWSSWYNQPTAQLYHVAATHEFPYKVCGGQQESGSVCISSRGNDGEITFRDWHPAGVIEYGYAAPDPLHPEIVFGAGRTEVSKYNSITGQVENVTPIPVRGDKYRGDRTEPLLFSPVNKHRMYYASNVLWQTDDGGRSWSAISPDLSREHAGQPDSLGTLAAKDAEKRRGAIYSVAASFQNTNTIWAGSDDGLVWVTRDGGKNWKDVTPPGLSPWSKVTQISASHFDDQTAYVSVSRFRVDDMRPYMYRTHDGGATWQEIVSGLPEDSPVNTVREDTVRKGMLFAGTETAVWVSMDDGSRWRELQFNLPHTSMRDLLVQGNDVVVATHGRSFWVLDDISPLRQVDAAGEGTKAVLFKPGAAYRVRRSTNTDTPLPIDEPAAQNPPDGAVIDYALPEGISGPVVLEILDAKGQVARKYSSEDKPYATQEELSKQLIPLYWIRMPRELSAAAGMHRWVWDLRYTAPTATRYEYPISAVPHDTPRIPQGPLALPGEYTVRMTAGGKVLTAPLTVKMDPRVTVSAAELAGLFNLESRLSGMVGTSSEASLEAHSLAEQVDSLTQGPEAATVPASVKAFRTDLNELIEGGKSVAAGKDGLDEISGEISSLYLAVGQADAMPTVAQSKAAGEAGEELARLFLQWGRVKEQLASVNRELTGAKLAPLDLKQRPRTMPEGGDEE